MAGGSIFVCEAQISSNSLSTIPVGKPRTPFAIYFLQLKCLSSEDIGSENRWLSYTHSTLQGI